MIKHSRLGASIRAKKFCVLTTAESRGKIWKYFYFDNGLLKPHHKTLWESVIVLYFVVRYFMSILVLQSS